MMAAEIVQQEGDVVNNEGIQISNENLEEKITFYATERQKLESLLQSVEFLLSTCGSQVTLLLVIVIHILAMFLFSDICFVSNIFLQFYFWCLFDTYNTRSRFGWVWSKLFPKSAKLPWFWNWLPEWQLPVDNHCGTKKPQHKSTNPSGIMRVLLIILPFY